MRKRDQDRKLRKAALIILNGWTTKAYHRDGCYCSMGAINKAVFGTHYAYAEIPYAVRPEQIDDAESIMHRFACFLRGKKPLMKRAYDNRDFETITEFNDRQAVDKEQVARALFDCSYA